MTTKPPKPASLTHRPRVVHILQVSEETPTVKTFSFKDDSSAGATPGQFGMVWVPGVDEFPMSLLPSGRDDIVTIAVKERGEGSQALLGKRRGDLIGIRGPYGRGFTHSNEKKVLMVGGGTGAIPLLALFRTIVRRDIECSFVSGANSSRELIFLSEIRQLVNETGGYLAVTTDDGSAGTRGLATDEAAKLLGDGRFDRVYTCGPERMMKKVMDLAEKAHVPAEAGLERIFKCGSGICGSCCIGSYLACKDGPVFSDEILKHVPEFGKTTRDASGRPIVI
jgi:dihydroorotate dehydrogenase electron transfer subunit